MDAAGRRDGRASVRVAVAGADARARARLRGLLDGLARIDLVGVATDAAGALALVRGERPDVALLHVDLPGPDGATLTHAVVGTPDLGGVRVLLAAADDADGRVDAGLRAGAIGVVAEEVTSADLRRAVRVAADGLVLLDPSAAVRIVAAIAADPPAVRDGSRLLRLTPHERDALVLVARGVRDDEVAARLRMSLATVRTHLQRARGKLGARDRAHLVVVAYEAGLVAPSLHMGDLQMGDGHIPHGHGRGGGAGAAPRP